MTSSPDTPRVVREIPYPVDESTRLTALLSADLLDTPAEDVYDEIVRAAAELCGAPISLVSLIDADRQWFKAKVGIEAEETPRDLAFCAHAICANGLMEVPDAHHDARFVDNPLVVEDPRIRFYAGVPLQSPAGYSYGTLCVIDTVPRTLTREQRQGLERLARQVTVLIELRRTVNDLRDACRALSLAHQQRDSVEADLRHRAHYDVLTGLPNRALLMDHVHCALEASRNAARPVSMLVCDVDDFKLVNDGLGHPAGDQLLVEIALRIRSAVRETDMVARFGGDEFVVVLSGADEHDVAAVASRVLASVAEPFSIGGRDALTPSISIGIATTASRVTGDELLSNADAAMYKAKSLGKGRMWHFDAPLRAEIVTKLTFASDFQLALDNHELFCVHQPEIDLLTGQLFGMESLVRWAHRTRGLVMPDSFVPILEATSGTDELFDRVLDITLAAQARWADQLGQHPSVAVNLSARQLNDTRLAKKIAAALTRFGAPPESLWLEVTESAVASAPTFDTLNDVHALGVHLAIDDFGVGWSSMARLSDFPWDLLKIDRKLISPLGQTDKAEHILRGIISLAHSLGIRTSAEGVETADQLHRLRGLGCDIAQGYLIDRPITAELAGERMTRSAPTDTHSGISWSAASERHLLLR